MLLESSKPHPSVTASRATLMRYTDQTCSVLLFFLGVVSLPSLTTERSPSLSEAPASPDLAPLLPGGVNVHRLDAGPCGSSGSLFCPVKTQTGKETLHKPQVDAEMELKREPSGDGFNPLWSRRLFTFFRPLSF